MNSTSRQDKRQEKTRNGEQLFWEATPDVSSSAVPNKTSWRIDWERLYAGEVNILPYWYIEDGKPWPCMP